VGGGLRGEEEGEREAEERIPEEQVRKVEGKM
jgi:hypothetical protein